VFTLTSGVNGNATLGCGQTVVVECPLTELTPGGMVGTTRKTRAEKKSSRHAAREDEDSLELSPLDLQVLGRLRQGKTSKTIAHELSMSESTVQLHIRHSLERINARNRAELLLLIRRLH
jgi:DNA-binding NarL/FixJ family response regulator